MTWLIDDLLSVCHSSILYRFRHIWHWRMLWPCPKRSFALFFVNILTLFSQHLLLPHFTTTSLCLGWSIHVLSLQLIVITVFTNTKCSLCPLEAFRVGSAACCLVRSIIFSCNLSSFIFVAHQYAEARYWYSNSVLSLPRCVKERRRGAHLYLLGRLARRWINHYCLWRHGQCDARHTVTSGPVPLSWGSPVYR